MNLGYDLPAHASHARARARAAIKELRIARNLYNCRKALEYMMSAREHAWAAVIDAQTAGLGKRYRGLYSAAKRDSKQLLKRCVPDYPPRGRPER
jgi:hypothetical protein